MRAQRGPRVGPASLCKRGTPKMRAGRARPRAEKYRLTVWTRESNVRGSRAKGNSIRETEAGKLPTVSQPIHHPAPSSMSTVSRSSFLSECKRRVLIVPAMTTEPRRQCSSRRCSRSRRSRRRRRTTPPVPL
jgi:hypothetical protein